MNKTITTILALIGLAFSAQAKVGWTLEQARAHYGKEVKSEKAWCGGTAYGFIHDGLYIYATISSGDTIGDVIYFDNKGKKLSDAKKTQLLRFNKEGIEYEPGTFLWNGERNSNQLGHEYFKHTVILRPSSFYGLVYNDCRPEKVVGFQVRSTSQFDFEQKSIK
jgi:hypothetical protein